MYRPNSDAKTSPRTVFSRTSGDRPAASRFSEDVVADVAIVGGGFVGITAALYLARGGAKVVVLESNQIGWGAAGRNAGQVSAHATKLEPWDVVKIYGDERGARLNEAGAGAPQFVLDLAEEHGIDISAVRGGILSAAHTTEALEKFRKRAEFWQRLGANVELVGRQQVADVLGFGSYLGGVIDRRGIAINPLAFVFGLARAAVAHGATLFENAHVDRLERVGQSWTVGVGQHRVSAEHVLLCTNAYTDTLWPMLRETVIPVRAYQMWTKPLEADQGASILRGISAFNDSQRVTRGARKHLGGELQLGVSSPTFGRERAPTQAECIARVRTQFPHLKGVEIDGWWSGWVTRGIGDGWRLHQLAPGLATAIACNGRGVAMGPIMGRELARLVSGTSPQDLLVPLTSPKPIVGHRFMRPFAEVTAKYYGYRDRKEIRDLISNNTNRT